MAAPEKCEKEWRGMLKECESKAATAAQLSDQLLRSITRYHSAVCRLCDTKDDVRLTTALRRLEEARSLLKKAENASESCDVQAVIAKNTVNAVCKIAIPQSVAASERAALHADRAEICSGESHGLVLQISQTINAFAEKIRAKEIEEAKLADVVSRFAQLRPDTNLIVTSYFCAIKSCEMAEKAARTATSASRSAEAKRAADSGEREAEDCERAAGEVLRASKRVKEFVGSVESGTSGVLMADFLELGLACDRMREETREAAVTARTAAIAARSSGDAPRFGGVGIKLRYVDGIGHVVEDISPFLSAGLSKKIFVGDIIEGVDDEAVCFTESVRDLISGPSGTNVSLLLRRRISSSESYCLVVSLERMELPSPPCPSPIPKRDPIRQPPSPLAAILHRIEKKISRLDLPPKITPQS